MTSLLKPWENFDLHKTRQIVYNLKGNDASFPKMQFFMNLIFWIKSYGHLSGIWPILVHFAMISH